MRLNADARLTSAVVPKYHPPRLQLRIGPHKYTLTDTEALRLADQLVDATEQLRNRTDGTASCD